MAQMPSLRACQDLIGRARRFAYDLGMQPGGTFEGFEEAHPVYSLVVSYPGAVMTALPGGAPFEMSMDPASIRRGRKRAAGLAASGLHVHGRSPAAVSGSFPLTKDLIERPLSALLDIFFHEALHNTRSARGWGIDYPLEESLACYVGGRASAEFCGREILPELADECRERASEWRDYAALVNLYAEQLAPSFQRGEQRRVLDAWYEDMRELTAASVSLKDSIFQRLPKGQCNNGLMLDKLLYTWYEPLASDFLDERPLREIFAEESCIPAELQLRTNHPAYAQPYRIALPARV